MKNLQFGILFLTALIVSFLSCEDPTNNNPNNQQADIGTLQNMNQNGIKKLYSSSIKVNTVSPAKAAIPVNTIIKTISYINENNNIVPITFTTSKGNEVVLNITNTLQVGSKQIIVRFSAIYEVEIEQEDGIKYTNKHSLNGQILIEMDTGKLYDFSGFNSIEYESKYGKHYLVDGDTLYTSNGTLYKIDLSNISEAIPLNNAEYFPSGVLHFILGNKIITSTGSFDVNGKIPPKQVLPFIITSEECSFAVNYNGDKENFAFGIDYYDSLGDIVFLMLANYYSIDELVVKDNNGDLWLFCFRACINGFSSETPLNAYFACKLTIADNGQLGFSEYFEGYVSLDISVFPSVFSIKKNDKEAIYFEGSNGIVLVMPNPSGSGLMIKEVDRLTALGIEYLNFDTGEIEIVADAYYYDVREKSVVKVMRYVDAPPVVVYTNTEAESIWMIDDRIYFWKWLDALTGATYFVPLDNPSAEPELVTSSTAQTIEIIEILDFDF